MGLVICYSRCSNITCKVSWRLHGLVEFAYFLRYDGFRKYANSSPAFSRPEIIDIVSISSYKAQQGVSAAGGPSLPGFQLAKSLQSLQTLGPRLSPMAIAAHAGHREFAWQMTQGPKDS